MWFQVDIFQVIVHQNDLGEQLSGIFSQNKFVSVHVETDFRTCQKVIQNFNQNVFVELEVDFNVLEQCINDHNVKIFLQSTIEDDFIKIFVDVVNNEWNQNLHFRVLLDDIND